MLEKKSAAATSSSPPRPEKQKEDAGASAESSEVSEDLRNKVRALLAAQSDAK